MNKETLIIMLVEDNPDHAKMIMRGLSSIKIAHQIYHLENGEAALDYLYRRRDYSDPQKSPRPNVILLDLRLPKVDGLEVLKEIKSSKRLLRIPVVILTTSGAEEDMQSAYDHYANSYLVKPIDFEKFTKLMRTLGFYWLNLNKEPQ